MVFNTLYILNYYFKNTMCKSADFFVKNIDFDGFNVYNINEQGVIR